MERTKRKRKPWFLHGIICMLFAISFGGMDAQAAVPSVTESKGTITWDRSDTVSYTFAYDIDAGSARITEINYSGTSKAGSISVPSQMQVKYQSKTKKLNTEGIGDGTNVCVRNTGKGVAASITLPAAVKEIGANAFSGYAHLTTMNTGNGVADIGEAAFKGCTSLGTLTLGEGVVSVGDNAFLDAPLSKMVTFNCISLQKGSGLFKDHRAINEYKVGSKVTIIPDELFAGCTGIEAKTIAIPNSVKYLGSNAFDSCGKVETITLGTGLLEMGTNVFKSAYPLYPHDAAGIAKNKNQLKFNCINLADVKKNFKNMEDRIAVRYGGAITIGKETRIIPDEIRELMDLKFPNTTSNGKPGEVVSYTAPYTGRYLLQAWGAAGGGGAAGGYSYGYYDMEKGEKIYIYTGKAGVAPKKTEKVVGGWNGGGDATLGAKSGGGATDFRTVKSKGGSGWNDQAKGKETPENLKTDASLQSRIMVAGGGGGAAANGDGMLQKKEGETTGYTAEQVIGNSSIFGVGGGTSGGASDGVEKKATQSGGYSFGMGEDSCTTKAPTGHPNENPATTYGGAGGGGYYGGGQSHCGRYTKLRKEDGKEIISEVGGSGGGGSGYLGGVYGVNKTFTDSSGIPHDYQDWDTYAGIGFYKGTPGTGKDLIDSSTKQVIYGPNRGKLTASGERQLNGAASITYVGAVQSKVTLTIDKKVGSFGGEQSISFTNYAHYTGMLPKPDMINGYEFMYYERYSGDGIVNEDGSYTYMYSGTMLRAVYSGELKLSQQVNGTANEGKGAVDLIWSEDDDFVKLFYVQQSTDKVNWANLGDNGQRVEDLQQGFVRQKVNGHGSKPNTAFRETYVIPHAGLYYFTAAGGSGGVAHGAHVQGVGGLVKGKLSLKKGDVLTIELGGRGGNANGGGEEEKYRGMGGFNGGGGGIKYDEKGSYWGTGAGGGATRILVNDVTVMMAGGGGGGNTDGGGGYAGGTKYTIATDKSQDNKDKSKGTDGSTDGKKEKGGGGGGFLGGSLSYGGTSFFNEGGTITARLMKSQGGGAKTLKLPDSLKGQYTSNDGMALLESYLIFPELTDNSYTAHTPDKAPPDAPTGGKGEQGGEGIQIHWEEPMDHGSIYYHRVGSCYDGGLTELRMSEELQSPEVCSGLEGYYYYIDTYPTGVATKENGIHLATNKTDVSREENGKYVHVAAIDRAGNLGPTHSFLIDVPMNYTITFHGNDNWNKEQGAYTQELEYNQEAELTEVKFNRKAPHTIDGLTYKEGYTFMGWSTSPDSDMVTYQNKQKVKNIGEPGSNVNLFAVWSKEITLTFKLMGGNIEENTSDIILTHTITNATYSTVFNLKTEFDAYGSCDDNGINKSIRRVTKEDGKWISYRLLGWTTESQAKVSDLRTNMCVYEAEKVIEYACTDSVTLYAVWEPILYLRARGDKIYGEKGTLAEATAAVTNRNTSIMPLFRDGQRGKYTVDTYGRGDIMEVEFDSKFTWIYEAGSEEVKDGLNPPTEENAGAANHGLNRLIRLDNALHYQQEARYFRIPNYLGTGMAPGSISSGFKYNIKISVTNYDSYYWNNYRGINEKATVYFKLGLGEDEEKIHPEFRTRLL